MAAVAATEELAGSAGARALTCRREIERGDARGERPHSLALAALPHRSCGLRCLPCCCGGGGCHGGCRRRHHFRRGHIAGAACPRGGAAAAQLSPTSRLQAPQLAPIPDAVLSSIQAVRSAFRPASEGDNRMQVIRTRFCSIKSGFVHRHVCARSIGLAAAARKQLIGYGSCWSPTGLLMIWKLLLKRLQSLRGS